MAHGHADYGVGTPVQTVHTSMDVAELAARLGSPDTFDRRGNVLWFDDFEGGIEKWSFGSVPAGGSLVWSSDSSKTGRFCAKLTAPAMITGVSQMTCRLAYPVTTRLGFEVAFSLPVEDLALIYLQLHLFLGRVGHLANLGYDGSTHGLVYVDRDAGEVVLTPPVELGTFLNFFHVIKVVVDIETSEYVRAVLDNHEWDLTGGKLQDYMAPDYDELVGVFGLLVDTIDQPHALVDNCIVTMNEP